MAQPSIILRPSTRRGFSLRGVLFMLGLAVIVGVAFWLLRPAFSFSSTEPPPIMHIVERGEFIHDITDRGEVESANNVEIRCEVKSGSRNGATILKIVPEGTIVEANQVVVEMDASALENDRTKQQIVVNTSEASVIQAQNSLDTAEISLKEYIEGDFKLEEQKILNTIIVAEEDLRRAEEYYTYSQRLAAKGYVTSLQLEADRFAVDKARNELESAQTELSVLRKYTRLKTIKQLEADVKTAEAKLRAEQDSLKLDQEQLALIESQIEKCTIRAPEAGQVVYANVTGGRGRSEVIIEEGTLVREGQVMIRLPDSNRMQVKAKINESKITRIVKGMLVTVKLDAFPDLELEGKVKTVGDYPAPTSWFAPNVKEYEALINIAHPPADIRPGLTAQVTIHVEHLDDVIRVPVQAVFEYDQRFFCIFPENEGYRAQEVQIGSNNDSFVVICEGLKPQDSIVLDAMEYRDRVELPALKSLASNTQPLVDQPSAAGHTAVENTGAAADHPRPRFERPTGPAERASAPGGRPSDPAGRPGPPTGGDAGRPNVAAIVARIFESLDSNSDGKIQAAEMPADRKAQLQAADSNGDGEVDRAELAAGMRRVMQAMPGGGGPAPAGGAAP